MANTLRFKRGLVSGIPTAALGEPLFTTDTFDLYIGNGTGNTRFQKYIASGTTSQLLRGDGSLLTMPIVLTSPSNGQVLKFNGTNWVNDSDAGITGSGSAGQVAYFTGATTQSGSNNLFWDATNNRLGIGTNTPVNRFQVDGVTVGLLTVQAVSDRVGIGTTSPNSRLEVYSATGYNVIRSVGASGGYFETYSTAGTRHSSFGSESNGDVYLGARANNPMLFLTNNTVQMRLFANGNLGVGVSSDAGFRIDVNGTSRLNGITSIIGSTTSAYISTIRQTNTTADVSFGLLVTAGTSANDVAFRVQNAVQSTNYFTVLGNGTSNFSGNVLVGSTTDNGLRFQVTGDGYFSGSVGIGSASFLSNNSLRVAKNITGSNQSYGVSSSGQIQSDVTVQGHYFITSANTQATAFTLSNLYHYSSTQGTFGASSAVTNQYGFFVDSTLIGATNNYGFYGNIAAATGRWNLYMNGSAQNFISGNLGIGVSVPATKLEVSVTGNNGIRIANSGNTGSDYSVLDFVQAGGQRAVIYTNNNNFNLVSQGALLLHSSGTLRATLDASGNLGLGVTSPLTRLHLGSTGGSPIYLEDTDFTSTYNITSISNNAGNFNIETRSSAGAFVAADYQIVKETVSSSYQRWFTAAGTERMRLFNTGNLVLNSTTDNGLRLQVTGDGFFSGSVGIGSTSLTNISLRISKTITGITTGNGVWLDGQVQSDVTSSYRGFRSTLNIVNSTFTLANVYHVLLEEGTIGASSTVTNQYGIFLGNLTKGGSNFGIYNDVSAGTNKWGYYGAGTANNYMAGSLGIGTTTLTGYTLAVGKNITGSTNSQAIRSVGVIQSDVTSKAYYYTAQSFTANANFALPDLYLYAAFGGTLSNITAGGSITNQYGYFVDASLTGATSNFGFYGNIASGTNRWNLYMNGTAANFLNGNTGIGRSPGVPLDVAGTIRSVGSTGASSPRINLLSSGFWTWGIYGDGNNLKFQNDATDRLTLNSDGNLGLGVTPSAWSSGQAAIQGSGWAITQTGVNNTYYIQNANFNGTNWIYRNSFAASFYLQQAGSHQFWYAPSGTAGNVITAWNQGMTLFATGNFTVGNNVDAGFKLDVNGTMRVSGATTITGSLGSVQVLASGAELYFTRNANNDLYANGGSSAAISIGAQSHVRFLTGTTLTEIGRFTTNAFQFSDGINIVLNATTGTKIGTATSQKLSFWNAAPIVQPTTAVASATRVGGAGNTITDTDTFDGYTMAQVVKALRNAGLLA